MALELDRMLIEEAGNAVGVLVAELHSQLGEMAPPIPVHDIARALDIVDLRADSLTGFEGCLITNTARSDGSILVNASSSKQRQRYTVAHELAHFLCTWHVPLGDFGFRCTRSDLVKSSIMSGAGDRQEVEANSFAIELLAPPRLLRPYIALSPDLDHVLDLAGRLDISREAAARRYADLHRRRVALIFAREGCCRFISRREDFPWIRLRTGDPIPDLPQVSGTRHTSEVVEADFRDWLSSDPGANLGVQVLQQQDGYQTIMLALEAEP